MSRTCSRPTRSPACEPGVRSSAANGWREHSTHRIGDRLVLMSETSGATAPLGSDLPTTGYGPLLRLVAVVVAGVALAVALGAVPVLVVVLALVAMVMLHELAHFATAKWSGMKVTEYFLGFGPRLWSIRRGETEYGVKAIPAGGYVRIVGMTMLEDVDPADEARSYRQATFPRRFLVAVAGRGCT